MIYLNKHDIARIVQIHLPVAGVRDWGLIESALARPQASFGGQDTYTSLAGKGAALVQSIVTNQPLVDGNKRLGLISLLVFIGFNNYRLSATNDEAYDFIMAIASGSMRDLEEIESWISDHIEPYIA